jgi:hypothetical protein
VEHGAHNVLDVELVDDVLVVDAHNHDFEGIEGIRGAVHAVQQRTTLSQQGITRLHRSTAPVAVRAHHCSDPAVRDHIDVLDSVHAAGEHDVEACLILLAELEIEGMPVDKMPREFDVAPRLVILEDLRSISIHFRHLFAEALREALRASPLRHDHALIVLHRSSRSLQHVVAFETVKKIGSFRWNNFLLHIF